MLTLSRNSNGQDSVHKVCRVKLKCLGSMKYSNCRSGGLDEKEKSYSKAELYQKSKTKFTALVQQYFKKERIFS